MINIEITLNGKPFNPDDFKDAFEKMIYNSIVNKIDTAVGAVRCPEHGSQATIKASGTSLDNLSFTVSGCCDKLISAVKERFS